MYILQHNIYIYIYIPPTPDLYHNYYIRNKPCVQHTIYIIIQL